MNELHGSQPADKHLPREHPGEGVLAEPRSRSQYAEKIRLGYRDDQPPDRDIPSVDDGLQALAQDRDSRQDRAEPRSRLEVSADERELDLAERRDPKNDRFDVAARYPSDYVPSDRAAPDIDHPHQSPEAWIGDINPGREARARRNNCGECSRAVENTWEGEPAVAAALADPLSWGEPTARMTDWAGVPPVGASMAQIGDRLTELGPGSSAIVGCDWNAGGGHWFNAINDGGTVMAVDGQKARIETWPPSFDGVGYSEDIMRSSDAIFFSADGKVLPE